MINKKQILEKVSQLPIEDIATATNFYVRTDKTVTGFAFITSFFFMLQQSDNTLSTWTKELSEILGHLFNPSSLIKKLQFPKEKFVKEVVEQALKEQIQKPLLKAKKANLFTAFRRVFIEDSTCINLPDNLAKHFGGPYSPSKNVATSRIQYRYEILSGQTARFEVQSYRDNDQKFASDILHTLKAGDLVIRDLGYFVLPTFKLINWMEAFFVSRYKFNTNIYDPVTHEQIDLTQLLRKTRSSGKNFIDIDVLIGKEQLMPVRFIALLAPQNVAQQRQRKAAKDRHSKINHSKEYMEALEWSIFITNVSFEIWTPKQVFEAYGFRWRIEVIFKAWKSGFKFSDLFKSKNSMSLPRAIITFWLLLLWITLFFVKWYAILVNQVFELKQRWLSLLKFAKFVKQHFVQMLLSEDLNEFVEVLAKYYCYDKRDKIPNFIEKLYVLN